MVKRPIVLVILDGWGIGEDNQANPFAAAAMPNFKMLEKEYPFLTLEASGIAVGLPWRETGNSEVGHITIGSGRINYHYLPRIILSIRDGSFFKNPAFLKAANHVKENNSTLHLMGLLSSGSVNSYIDHIYALLESAQRENIKKVLIHIFTDGRNAPLREALTLLGNFSKRLEALNQGKIASAMGRFYAMDRDNNWERTEKAYLCLTEGKGRKYKDPLLAIKDSYDKGETDEFIEPAIITDQKGEPLGLISDNDAVVFFNWRADNARQIAESFVLPNFNKFPREKLKNLLFVTMASYEKDLPVEVAFPPQIINNTLSEVLSANGKKQFKIAESEKYAHITYFFNGGVEKVFPGEERVLMPSLEIIHLEEKPEMRAFEIAKRLASEIKNNSYDFLLANFANGDMMGHTGNFEACVKAAEIIDECIGKIIETTLERNGTLLITSDHGNVEEMIDLMTGRVKTSHTFNLVPFYLVAKDYKKIKGERETSLLKHEARGLLSDVAPTILELMGIEKPKEMTGRSLLASL